MKTYIYCYAYSFNTFYTKQEKKYSLEAKKSLQFFSS